MDMEQHKDNYLDFIINVKGVSKDYARITSYRLNRLIIFLRQRKVKNIQHVTRQDLEEYEKFIRNGKYTQSTVADMLSAVIVFFRYLYDYGHIKENTALVIETPKVKQRIPRHIMNEEEIKYLIALPNKDDLLGARDICIMKLLYSSAMRPKEVFDLKLEDIDLKRGQALVRRPKNRRDRIVHFDRYTKDCLKNYIEKTRPWLLKGRLLDYLFIGMKTDKFNTGAWGTHFKRAYTPILKKKFNKLITSYAFRHTSATQWLDSAAKQKKDVLPFIQRQLGHESLESTAIYTHVAIEPLRQMFKKYHPREISLKKLHKIPSPKDIISRLNNKKDFPR